MKNIYISNICCWAPGLLDNEKSWQEWKAGNTEIENVKESPKLEYTEPLFRRRLSQITKMTVQVVHQFLEKTNIDKETKLIFISLRGEIEREFSINKSLIEEQMILPASFSLSVFNTPISSATLAFGLKGGYSVIFPSKNDFSNAFQTAIAPILAESEKNIILVYADEYIPDYYKDFKPENNIPLAFAALLSSENTPGAVEISNLTEIPSSPAEFLKRIL